MSVLQDDAALTVNKEEMIKFKSYSSLWWKTEIRITPLIPLNRLRVPWIVDGIVEAGLISKYKLDSLKPLQGLKILEVGCGGNYIRISFILYPVICWDFVNCSWSPIRSSSRIWM